MRGGRPSGPPSDSMELLAQATAAAIGAALGKAVCFALDRWVAPRLDHRHDAWVERQTRARATEVRRAVFERLRLRMLHPVDGTLVPPGSVLFEEPPVPPEYGTWATHLFSVFDQYDVAAVARDVSDAAEAMHGGRAAPVELCIVRFGPAALQLFNLHVRLAHTPMPGPDVCFVGG